MAMYNVYSHPEFRLYRASICSKATLFMIVMYSLTFIVPLLIVYRSNGLWITTSTIFEQATVHYKHDIISYFDVNDDASANSYIAWSTYPQFNIIHQENMRVPVVKSRESDNNRDGKKDALFFDLEIPIKSTEDVHAFHVLLFFEYKLKKKALVTLEGLAHIAGQSYLPGSAFTTTGELRLKQRNPIPHKGIDSTYSSSLVQSGSLKPSDYDIAAIFKEYSSRNLTTYFSVDYHVWTGGKSKDGKFRIQAEIKYPEEAILFHTGFWQMIKYAVVQYIAILIIFAFLIERLKMFVFSHQLISTVTLKPYKSA